MHRLILFTILILLAVTATITASGQTILGKHPADKVVAAFLQQNTNADTVVLGINANATSRFDLNSAAFANVKAAISAGGLSSNEVVQAINSNGIAVYPIAIVAAVTSENTNELYVTNAGTTAANGKYVFSQSAFATVGWIYTNTAGTAFLCKNLDGLDGDTDEQNPFYLGSTTNNNTSAWYFSPYDERFGWTANSANFGALAGANPAPTVTYGTNSTLVTNIVTAYVNYKPFNAGNELLVDSTFPSANDVAATNGWTPFKTLTAAKNFATAGQTIRVRAGTYNESNLLKDRVNWVFDQGAVVALNEPVYGTGGAVFDDRGLGAVHCSISGDYFDYRSCSPYSVGFMAITNPASEIYFTANKVHADRNSSTSAGGLAGIFSVVNCAYVGVTLDQCLCSNLTRSVVQGNQFASDYGTLVSQLSNFSAGMYWKQGDMHVRCRLLDVKGDAAEFVV